MQKGGVFVAKKKRKYKKRQKKAEVKQKVEFTGDTNTGATLDEKEEKFEFHTSESKPIEKKEEKDEEINYKCARCQTQLTKGAPYCPGCGMELNEGEY